MKSDLEKRYERLTQALAKAARHATRELSFAEACNVTLNVVSSFGAHAFANIKPSDRDETLTALLEDMQDRIARRDAEDAATELEEGVTTH